MISQKLVFPVHLIGVGRIGSDLALPLKKFGIPLLHLWDRDVVEARNIPVQQIYRPSDVGKPKVQAAYDILTEQYGFPRDSIIPHEEWVTASTPLDGIVISGVDSMESRQAIWQSICRQPHNVQLYLDGRLGKENSELYVVRPVLLQARREYEGELCTDDQVAPFHCSDEEDPYPPTVITTWVLSSLRLFIRKNIRPFRRWSERTNDSPSFSYTWDGGHIEC